MSRRHHGRHRHPRPRQDEPGAAQARGATTLPNERPLEVEPASAPAQQPAPEAHASSTNGASAPIQPAGAAPSQQPTRAGCTAPQLRRFIKSRPYVPMHELRRRFGINGAEDDVTPLALDGGHIYVGLPEPEGKLLGELVRGGEVGYELSLDPRTPIVVGVYPMRPVPRG
jgi:hypothetical protein